MPTQNFKRKEREVASVVSDSFETPWTIAYQAPPSVGFSRQEYWSGLPFSSPIHTDIRVTSLLVGPDAPHFGTKNPECEDSW